MTNKRHRNLFNRLFRTRAKESPENNENERSDKSDRYIKVNGIFIPKEKTPFLLKNLRGGKSVWDWLDLVIAPALVALLAGFIALISSRMETKIFEKQNEIFKQQNTIAEDKNQRDLLIKYLDDVSTFIENYYDLEIMPEEKDIKTLIVRARTLTLLKALDSQRKGELINFLSNSRLITTDFAKKKKPIISLNNANIRGAYLSLVNLRGADLVRVNLSDTKNLTNQQIKQACFWEEAIYKGVFFDSKKGTWGAIEPDNTNYIEELKQDKVSNPNKLPDCSFWGNKN